jgi:ADP-ribose pyrophosphatase YjhB (NUDIX family)
MEPTSSALAAFIAPLHRSEPEYHTWPTGRFEVHTFLHTQTPPDEFIISARAVVVRDDEVLVVQDPSGYHILPGGRREAGETYEQTALREVLEETGWEVVIDGLLGFKHFYRLTPKAPEISYPYPDFAQLVYRATPVRYRPEAREVGGYELGAAFMPIAQLDQLQLTPGERLLLQAALAGR